MDTSITCLNGQFLPAPDACIPVSDRGFRFGDGIFETVRVESGVPYRWEQHLERLLAGLQAIRIPAPSIDWRSTVRETLQKNRAQDGFLRMTVSRGDGSIGYLPAANLTPTWAIEYLPARPLPGKPYDLWLSSHRRPSPASMPVNHKLTQGLCSTLALLEAQDAQCEEALLLSTENHLCSAAAGNLFWIHQNRLYTPALSTGCLNGITRRIVCAAMKVEECKAPLDTLHQAEAAFLTNSRVGIWPIAQLKNRGKSFNETHALIGELKMILEQDKKNYNLENSEYWKNNT